MHNMTRGGEQCTFSTRSESGPGGGRSGKRTHRHAPFDEALGDDLACERGGNACRLACAEQCECENECRG